MKKGEVGVGIIERVSFPDRGVVVREDGTVHLKHAVPGRTVRYRIRKKRNGSAEGILLGTEAPSPIETASDPCPNADLCGGCLYQTVPYSAQLSLKEKLITELLHRMTPDDFTWEGLTPSPEEEGYRLKMEYTFGDGERGGELMLGLHKRDSHFDIVAAEHCRLVHEDFNVAVRETLAYFREKKKPFYHKLRHDGYLRYLLVRRGRHSGEILIDLVTTSGAGYREPAPGGPFEPERGDFGELLRGWSERLQAAPFAGRLTGVLHTVTDSTADAVVDQGTEILFGTDAFEETLCGLRFRITPFSFFQNNADAAELLYRKAAEYLGSIEGMTVYDLYSGTGTIAQIAARTASHVVGVELVPEAVEAARLNAARNGITNCEFVAGDVLKVLDSLPRKPDAIILDPPRDGVHPKAMERIAAYGVPRIVYISCKATSLAGNLLTLREAGYRLERASAVDLFPQTPNVEVIALLSKGQPGGGDCLDLKERPETGTCSLRRDSHDE